MSELSVGDTTLLESDLHKLRLFASPLTLRIVWKARVNDAAIENEEQTIAFDSGEAGDAGTAFSWVEPHQTVWVSSTGYGNKNIGKLRIKSISSGDGGVTGTLVVGAHEVPIDNNDFLTFTHNYEIWSCFPRLGDDETFYKDWDVDGGITYGDENEDIPGVTIGGCHRAAFLVAGSVALRFPVGDSYAMAPGATISSVGASVLPSGGTSVGAQVDNYIPITFTLPGQYWVKLSSTDSNGKTQLTYRFVSVHEDNKTSAYYPITVEEADFSGSWAQGGWTFSISARSRVTLTSFPDETLVVLWQHAYYGGTLANVSILPATMKNIVGVGYLQKDKTEKNRKVGGNVSFELATAQAILDNRFMYSIPLEVSDNPDDWWKYIDGSLTAGHIAHFIYRWHSTALFVMDFIGLDDDGDIERKAVDMEKGSLYNMGNTLTYNNGILAKLVCDKVGRMHLARDLVYRNETDRGNATLIGTIEESHTNGSITITRKHERKTGFVFYSGVRYTGGVATPIGSTAPGTRPSAASGSRDATIDRQMVASQAQSNQVAGQIYAVENNEIEGIEVRFEHKNWLGVLDIAEMEWWRLGNVNSSDTPRGIVLTNQNMLCRQVSAKYDSRSGTISVNASFEAEVDGTDGVPYEFPDEVPEVGGDDPVITETETNAVWTAGSMYYLAYGAGSWVVRDADNLNGAHLDVFNIGPSPLTAHIFAHGTGFIQKSTDGGQTWSNLTISNPPNTAGDSPAPTLADVEFCDSEASLITSGTHAWVGRWQNADDEWRSWLLVTDDGGATSTWTSLSGGDAGEPHIFDTGAGITGSRGRSAIPVLGLSDTRAVALRRRGTATKFSIFLLDINGTVVTALDDIELTDGVDNLTDNPALALISGTRVLVAGSDFSDKTIAFIVDTASDTLSIIDSVTGPAGGPFGGNGVAGMARISATIFRYAFNDVDVPTSGTRVLRYEVAGDVLALDDDDQMDSVAYDSLGVTEISSTTFAISYYDGTNWFVQAFLDNPFTPGVEDELDGDGFDSVLTTNGRPSICRMSGTVLLVAYPLDVDANTVEIHVMLVTVSGTSLAPVSEIILSVPNCNHPALVPISATEARLAFMKYDGPNESDASLCMATLLITGGITLSETGVQVIDELGSGLFRGVGHSLLSTDRSIITYSDGSNNALAYVVDPGGGSGASNKALGLSLGKGAGESLYVTSWIPNSLVLHVFSLPGPVDVIRWSLGTTTEAQLDARTYIAYPICPVGLDTEITVYGRMNNPAGLGSPVHLIDSVDFGQSFILLENSFGDDYIGAATGHILMYYVLNVSGAAPKLYSGIAGSTIELLSTISPLGTAGVNPRGICTDFVANVLVASDTGQAVMTVFAAPPFGAWINFTSNHGTTRGVRSMFTV